MKKIFTLFAALFTMGAVMAQTIVSTEVEKRNVLIEEFTGVNCGFCPDGHYRANQICQQYEGHAWAINIHQGVYAAMYATQWGDGLAGQYDIEGYPCGVTNRCANMQDRGQWAATAAQIRTEDSPVNIAATASIDPLSRQLIVNVEMYYTGTQTVTSNYLNVVLLQNNVIGPQSNYGTNYQGSPYNSDYVLPDGTYRHMHMLRDMLTGQWGEEITLVAEGTLVERTYTYSIPAIIGDVAITDFDDLQVLAFVTETHKNVLTACEAEKTILPAAFCAGISLESTDCGTDFQPVMTIRNTTEETVTSFEVSIDGTMQTYSKPIAAGSSDTIHLPLYTIDPAPAASTHYEKSISVEFLGYLMVESDETVTVPTPTSMSVQLYDINVFVANGPFYFDLAIDHYGSEVHAYWLDQSNCSVLWNTPTFTNRNAQQLMPARHYFFNIDPAEAGTYILRITDDYGDGATYVSDAHGFALYDGNNDEVYSHDGDYGEGIDVWIVTTAAGAGTYVDIDDVTPVSFSVYPSPATDRLNINCNEAVREVSVIDITGRTLMTTGAVNSIDVSALASGVYVVRVATESGIGMQKFVKE